MPWFVKGTDIEITGTADLIPGTALISDITPDGTPVYAGETEVWWDDQKPRTRDGKILFADEDGNTHTFDEIEKRDD